MDGISASTADLMFKQDCAQATQNFLGIKLKIQDELIIDLKKYLIIGFNHFWVVWPVRNGVDYQGVPIGYQVMDYPTFHDWFVQNFGYMPTPDQIRVITLQDVQETPKGQPMQVQTFAQMQQQRSQQPAQGQGQNPGSTQP